MSTVETTINLLNEIQFLLAWLKEILKYWNDYKVEYRLKMVNFLYNRLNYVRDRYDRKIQTSRKD